jgi:hypothetical protein
MVMELDTSQPSDDILRICAKQLIERMTEEIAAIQPFGCCDAGGPEFFVRIESNAIMTEKIRIMANVRPRAFAELGTRFEATHSLMFGSKEICQQIKHSFRQRAKLFTSPTLKDFGVILLDESCQNDLAEKAKFPWLINNADTHL